MPAERKKIALACIECRARKRRCQFEDGSRCVICERLNIECVMVSDGRKERPQIRKISDLEKKVKHYKSVALELRESLEQVSRLLKKIEDDKPRPGSQSHEYEAQANASNSEAKPDNLSEESSQEPPTQSLKKPSLHAPRTYFQAKTFQTAKHEPVSVYGPTSIFDTELLPRRELLDEHKPATLSKNPKIIQCIQLFFRWQYPDMHAFIFREAFLLDFFDPDSLAAYSSTELVYAICAMGALMADDPEIRDSAEKFYCMSRDLLMAKIDLPSISSLQAYLLLGLYDIYNYRNNAGWMLTGDALRVGFGIGFHLRPESWLVGDQTNISEITVSVRSRIFWGCFMADRFVSLILGRPSVIKPDASTIHVSDNMPAIKWIQPYTYPGTDREEKVQYIDISNPLESIIKLAGISDNMMETVFSGRSLKSDNTDLSRKLDFVENYNRKIMQWRNDLLENLRWNREDLKAKGHDTTKMFTRYYFYLVLLCLNRPFIEISQKQPASSFKSLVICMDAINDIHTAIFSFIKAHGARRCSILIVYSSIISISILLAKTHGNFTRDSEEAGFFFDFMAVLLHTSPTWKLSENSFLKFRSTLKLDYGVDYETELQKYLDLGVPNFATTIFGLLNGSAETVSGPPDIGIFSAGASNIADFDEFNDPSAWSSLFPDFFSAETFN